MKIKICMTLDIFCHMSVVTWMVGLNYKKQMYTRSLVKRIFFYNVMFTLTSGSCEEA